MAGNIKGIIVEIGGDTSGLQKALSKVNSVTSDLSKELRSVNSLLKLDPQNTELLEQKQKLLSKSIEVTQDKLKQLQKIKEEADKKMSEGTNINEENYRTLQREIIKTQKNLSSLKKGLELVNSETSNWVKAGKKVEEFGNKVEKVSDKINNIGNKTSIVSAGLTGIGAMLITTAGTLETAVDKYIATTNTAIDKTETYKKVIKEINDKNLGNGYEDIANAMSSVTMQIKNLNESDLKNITEQAIVLRDLFGYEVNESIRAVKALIDNFNISAEDAFDLIIQGKNQGLDFSNELLDNVNEYSVQFNKLGLSAQDMFNIFKVGAENGAFNLDKIGDAVKEFSIRTIDGSNTTIDGFKRIGLNADEMTKKFAKGGEEAKQAFIEVVNRLGNMDDKVSQSMAGVDLFGTMWEDLGPTVVTSFSKMDNGIKQSSNTMQESIDTLYNSTQKRLEKIIKKVTNLGSKLGDKLLPVIEDLIDKAVEFVDGLEEMSDEELDNVIKIGLMVAAFGPAIKIIGKLTNTIGTGIKGLGRFTQAIAVVKTRSESANKSVNKMATGIKGLISPVGLATTTLALYSTGVGIVQAKIADEVKENKEFISTIEASTGARKDAIETINKNQNANLAEINNVQTLNNELKELVNENGKVKSGYEARVQFILNQLNNALGTEYSLNDNIINQYKDMQSSIDELMKKKEAQIILEANEEKYKEAIQNKTQAYKDYLATQEKINEILPVYNKLLEDSKKGFIGSNYSLVDGKSKLKEYTDELKTLYSSLEEQESIMEDYNNDILQFQKNSELMIKGGAENYQKIAESVAEIQSDITTTSNSELSKRINNLIAANEQTKKLYQLEAQYNKKAKDSIYAKNLEESEKNLQLAIDDLIAMTSTTKEMSPNVIEAWKNLAQNSRKEYNEALSKMPVDMQERINNITDTLNNDISTRDAAKFLGNDIVKNFDQSVEAEKAGKNLVSGVNKGLNNKTEQAKAQNSARTFSSTILNIFHRIWDEHSPSKASEKSAINLLKGVPIGLNKEAPKVYEETEKVVKNILEKFNSNLNFNTLENLPDINTSIKRSINMTLQPKILQPNIIINTQHLDNSEMNRIIDTVNRRFGMQI